MATAFNELYCSDACKSAERNRSFDRCPECNKIWDSRSPGSDLYYRNTAWAICNTCSRMLNKCVVCGKNAHLPK
jgi:hypothetical protein